MVLKVIIYVQGGYLVAHHDSEAHYQQPVLMIQLRSESALSFGYKAGGWSHLNEVHFPFIQDIHANSMHCTLYAGVLSRLSLRMRSQVARLHAYAQSHLQCD